MVRVVVTYKYGPKGQNPNVTRPSESVMAEAKTESAVLAALRKVHPAYGEIVVLEIK